MRSMAGLATVFGMCGGMCATSAFAQSTSLTLDSGAAQLMSAAFDGKTFSPRADSGDLIGNLLDRETFGPAGPVRWDNSKVTLGDNGGAVDSLRLSVGGTLRAPGGVPINVDRAEFQAQAWNAIFAPKGTSPEIVAKLNAAVVKALDDETVRKRLLDLGSVIPSTAERTPASLAALVKSEIAKWTAVVKPAN